MRTNEATKEAAPCGTCGLTPALGLRLHSQGNCIASLQLQIDLLVQAAQRALGANNLPIEARIPLECRVEYQLKLKVNRR